MFKRKMKSARKSTYSFSPSLLTPSFYMYGKVSNQFV